MSENEITYRPATRNDTRDIARLFQIASEGVADYLWSQLDDLEYKGLSLIEIGAKRYSREGIDFSYQNCEIAELGGKVVGMLHAFVMGDDVGDVDGDFDPVLKPYAELEEPQSLYISGLALFDQYRGLGIGSRFLNSAYQRARRESVTKTSLICFEENEGALRLYQREGFKERDRRAIVAHPLIQHGGDAILMVREE